MTSEIFLIEKNCLLPYAQVRREAEEPAAHYSSGGDLPPRRKGKLSADSIVAAANECSVGSTANGSDVESNVVEKCLENASSRR